MTFPEFQFQIERLTSMWPHAYPDERIKMIFQEINDLPVGWLIRTCDQFIGASRHAPLVPEFRDAANLYRKNKNAFPANGSKGPEDEPSMPPEEVHSMLNMLRKKMSGKLSDDEWNGFCEYMQSLLAAHQEAKRQR